MRSRNKKYFINGCQISLSIDHSNIIAGKSKNHSSVIYVSLFIAAIRYCYSHTIGKWRIHMVQFSQTLDTFLTTSQCNFFSVINTQLSNETCEVKLIHFLLDDVWIINLSPCWVYCMSLKYFKLMTGWSRRLLCTVKYMCVCGGVCRSETLSGHNASF